MALKDKVHVPLLPCHDWNSERVSNWIRHLHPEDEPNIWEEYAALFENEHIDGEALELLTVEDLTEGMRVEFYRAYVIIGKRNLL